MIETAEESAWNNDMKELCGTTRKVSGEYIPHIIQVRDKNDTILCSEENTMKRWMEYFSATYNVTVENNKEVKGGEILWS